jgi:hypothetical protein
VSTTRAALVRLAAIVVATGACVAVVHLATNLVVRSVAGLPLVLYLPGVALVWAVDPRGRQVTGIVRQVWIFGASMGVVIVSGLVINLAGGLTADHWLVWIGAETVLLAVVGVLRSVLGRSDGTGEPVTSEAGADGPPRMRLTLRQWVLLAAAVAVGLGTVAVSEHSVATTRTERFVQAWILPVPIHNPWGRTALVGIRNQTQQTQEFVITAVLSPLKGGAPTTYVWRQVLPQGRGWTREFNREPGEAVRVTVATTSAPNVVLSSVNLATPAH